MVHFKKCLQLFRQASFFWYLVSVFLATFAAGVNYVAITWWVLEVNPSVSSTAWLMLCFWTPVVVFGPLLGALGDRYSAQRLLLWGSSLDGLIIILFAYFFPHPSSALYLLMFVWGLVYSVYAPAYMTLVRMAVPAEDLLYANSTVGMVYEVMNVIGMGCAGFLVSVLSQRQLMMATGIIFCLSAVALMRVKINVPQQKERHLSYIKTIIQDFNVGIHYLRHNTRLIVVYTIQLCIFSVYMIAPVLLAPFAKNVLQANASQFGRMEAALSAGVVIGNVFLPWIVSRLGFIKTMRVVCTVLTGLLIVFGINRFIHGAEFLNFCIGLGLSIWPLIETKAQHLTDIRFQARVQSVFQSLGGILILGIYLLIGISSTRVPIPYFYGISAAIVLFVVYLLWRYRKLRLDESLFG